MSEIKNPKIMPNNLEAEQSLLGSMMIDDEEIGRASCRERVFGLV